MDLKNWCYQEIKFLITHKKKLAEDPLLMLSLNLEENAFKLDKGIIIERINKVQKECDHITFSTYERFSFKPFKGFRKTEKECTTCGKRF